MADQPTQILINDPTIIHGIMLTHILAGFGYRTPIYEAALRNDIDLAETTPGGEIAFQVMTPNRPILAVMGDDGNTPVGPEGFLQTAELLRWAGVVMLYTRPGQERVYREAVELAVRHRRCLLIEANTLQRRAWVARIAAEEKHRKSAKLPRLRVVDYRGPDERPFYSELPN